MDNQTENTKAAKKPVAKSGWVKWWQGQWIVRHVPFAFFLAVLAVVYIANGHYTDNTIRKIGDAQDELKQLQFQYKTLKAEVMYRSKESELSKAVEALGLKPLDEPPVKIEVPDKKQ